MKPVASPIKSRAELGFAALLGTVGVTVVIDAMNLHVPYQQSDGLGPKTVPYMVGALLLVCAVLLVINVLRGGSAEPDEGEDIEAGTPIDWKIVVPLGLVFIINIVFIDMLGWVISGTILFWGSVLALGGRNYIRDGLISVGMAVGTFYGFYLGLGIHLPSGLLEGVL
ncbi:tripartite tricarboxylate transporter TctB family protein [Paeniglutamicibacter gangotriensis]|uniref:Tripartite tricarboxylate transporter TctB family protein n=1 Tax=Paeniglutamicibacter gangotriensis TaxID=254787 RepID=A0A5B0E8V9_9MICC|nr:tripartite tricarboxylate transporter TctB family protein [Paeniglutamicibacter gangotriensis]KAA0974752.1 tripartite tricarboxylate transporter TctB family protein [Paeniglutamicibacter gangotriensis]